MNMYNLPFPCFRPILYMQRDIGLKDPDRMCVLLVYLPGGVHAVVQGEMEFYLQYLPLYSKNYEFHWQRQ